MTVGLTQYTQKGHIARATLEATCFQTKAILDAMEKDSGKTLSELAVDGGMSNSDLAMQVGHNTPPLCKNRTLITAEQTQADLISIPVYRPKMRETTALGAAIAAGLAVGIWRNFAELRDINRAGGAVFEPRITREESAHKFGEWEKAVRMSRGWIGDSTTSKAHDTKMNGTDMENRDIPVPNMVTTTSAPASLVSDLVSSGGGLGAPLKTKSRTPNGDVEFPPAKTPLISISRDLDGADEEELFLELRKVEILQKLKKLRNLKLSYY